MEPSEKRAKFSNLRYVPCVDMIYLEFLKVLINALEWINVILLYSTGWRRSVGPIM